MIKNGSKNLKQDCYNRSMLKKEQIYLCLGWENRWKKNTK